MIFVSDRTAWVFIRTAATPAVALNLSKALNMVWHVGFLHKRKFNEISGQVFGLILSFLSYRWL